MFKKQEGAKIKLILAGGVLAIILVIVVAVIMASIEKANLIKANPELGRAMNYEEFTDKDEEVEGTENVKFSAFFLRDINQDGYAEKIKGTCKEIGQEDTLYMEINVETAGMLKNAKIEIQGNNFYLQTALPKDNELKDNYIGNNIKVIEFNDLNNGTQKLLTGIVRSGDYSYTSSKADAIGNNINNLSRQDNKVILTGTYVNEENQEIEIRKEVNLETDWYGETRASISTTNQSKNLEDVIDEENGTINLDFTVYTNETANELIVSKNHVEGEIPELNGYAPTSVEYTGSTGNFNYNAETRTFSIDRIAEVDEQGNVTTKLSRSNSYGIKVVYPIEAYQTLGTETIQLKIPVKTYYEGYNNPNEEFINPYKSNTASSTIVVNYEKAKGTVSRFNVTVGKRVYDPTTRYIISKEKPLNIYNGISDTEKDDTYTVLWQAYVGTGENLPGLVMKETATGNAQVTDQFIKTNAEEESTDDVVSNVGVYFTGADNILGEDGWIKIYNEETGDLLVTFTKDDWNKYSSSNPYKYELPVKHIRVETSSIVNDESYLYVYNIKEIDDSKITEKYERAQFDELQYIKSTLVGYVGETYVNTDTHQANYEAPISVANIRISKNTISTQATEKNEIITIEAEGNTNYNEVKWKNGIFLVKLPEEIIDAQINNVEINNSSVNIESYELIEQDNCRYIKIVTKNDSPATYEITIDVDLSPDPRKATSTRNIELYASNENGENYYYKAQDIYDVNNNLNTEEQVNYRTTSISMISPNSLLTNQIASDYDDKGSEVISPQIADIKPIYAVVDQEQEVQTVKIGVQLKNNYASTTSEIQILGKIPFEGNTYVINGADLGSTFTSKMTNAGIELPEELKEIATVYYSENENPSRDLNDSANSWKTGEEVTNWDNVKTYLIDLGNYVMPTGKEFVFNYVVEIPNGLAFNEVAYSHHAIYFCLDTDEGKYRTETEPNKLGLRIAEKYNLELTKYQTGKDKLVPGATYRITDEETGESKTGVTNAEGKLEVSNLYAEKAYIIQEIKTPDDYELNSNIIRFIGHVDEEGNLSIERTEGFIKGDMTVTKVDGEEYKVNVEVEDEVKASIKITKKEEGTDTLLKGVRFKLTGYGLSENGRSVTTNANGEATLRGLSVEQEYTLEEVKAEGYYLASPIKFKIVNNDGNYSVEVLEGDNLEQNTVEDNGIPTINVTIQDEKIPTYDLELTKIKRTTPVEEGENGEGTAETTYLEGAKFKLYKGTEELGEYVTDNTGKLTITGLYQYEADKSIEQTYTLKEVLAPIGYAKVKDIKFKAQSEEGTLKLKEINEDGEESDSSRFTVEGNTIKLTVEDSPSFKLIKKDGETGEVLPNTKFAIYNVDEGEVEARNSKGEIIGTKETINGREYYTVTTDEKGELTLDLPEGLYKAVEIQANNEKYDISDATYYFGIGGSREATRTMGVTQATSIGGNNTDQINSLEATSDGGYIAGGFFASSSIQVGEYTLTNNGYWDGMIIKYGEEGDVDWARNVGGSNDDRIEAVAETSDGGYIVVGYFASSSIQVGDYTLNNNNSRGYSNGMIIKYSAEGEVDWVRSVGGSDDDEIWSVAATSNGEYIAGGNFWSDEIQVGEYKLTNNGIWDGMTIKYGEEGEVEWARSIGDTGYDYIWAVAATEDGGVIVGGYFESRSIQVGDYILESQDSYDGMIIKYEEKELINVNVSKAKSIGGKGIDEITSVFPTRDGGYIAVGYFRESTITLGDYTLENKSSTYDGMVIKYNVHNEVEWVDNISGNSNNYITSVTQTEEGDYVVGGYFGSTSIKIGEYILENSGANDGILIKYNNEGKVKWATSISGNRSEYIESVEPTEDGGVIVGGYFGSSTIKMGDYTLTGNGVDGIVDYPDGMVIKYNSEGEVEWAANIGGDKEDCIYSVSETEDNGYIAAGEFESESVQVGNYRLENQGSNDGMIIKYNNEGEVEWATSTGFSRLDTFKSITETADGGYVASGYCFTDNNAADGIIAKYSNTGKLEWTKNVGGNDYDYIESVAATKDGGYIVGGYFESSLLQVEDYVLYNNGAADGMVIKYNSSGEVDWAINIGERNDEHINSVTSTKNGRYLIGGYFSDFDIEAGRFILQNNGSWDGMILEIYPSAGVPEVQELTVENTRRQFKITTDVKEVDGIKGGNISGEDDNPYETVKYGESNTKEIIMTPDENYEIIGITVNGQEWQFEENTDGTYTMPQFNNVIVDKHIEVTYALKDNKLTINKVDSKTQEALRGATFKLDQIEERTEPENVIGEIAANGTEYSKADLENEILDVQGDLTNNGTYYFVQNDDGTLTPTNSKTYQIANEGSSGKQNTTANSYIPIDLTGLEGKYVVVVNAQVYSESADRGYATITTSTLAPTYSNTEGRFMYISGTSSSVTTAKDYTSNALTGGNTYYLHLGYRKDSSVDTGADQVVINSIKIYKANVTTYNFIQNKNGRYESNNQGVDSTTANSYIPIDLTEYTGKYNLIVNAQVSSQSSDYGYTTVTTSTSAPTYNSSTGRFIYISGEQEAQDYTTVLQGGQMYYLHLGYYKNTSTSSGDDKFTVNSVKVTLNDSELYHTEVTTNSEGQGIVQLPFGKYQITEIEAPEGYELLETPIEIEFRADGNHEVTISNMEKAKVIVHHYLKTSDGTYTTTKVADDELLEGKIDATYTTSPHLDLEKYQLEEDAEGNIVLPENAIGTYKSGIQEVTYYYEEKDIPLIVHHYIEGTETPVLLENGEQAKDEKYEGKENEEYTTNAISQEELNDKYELVEVPSNATGVYTPTETVVTYYYRVKDSAGVIVHHIDTETKEKIAPDVIIPAQGTGKYGDSYTTEVSEEIPANYEYVTKTDNWEGTMIDKLTEVTYEYKKVEPNIIDEQIEKTATQAIENPSAEIGYKIKYTTQVENYIGKAQITIEDELPYPIDTTKSELAGGTYNEANNTITWEEVVEGIDTYTQVESGKIEVNKTIKVVYKNVDDRNTEIENRVNGRLKLLTPEKTSEGVTTTAETVIKSVVNIPVSKVWEDDSDKLGKRPTRVVFKLTGSDGSEYTKELAKPGTQGSTTTQDSTNPNKWNDIFENLPKYDVNKQEIVYTLTELNGELTYYDASLDSTGRIVTNTSKYGKVTVHHYIMNTDGSTTTTRVPDANGTEIPDVVIEGKEGNPYATEEATNVSEKYELVEEKLPENAEGTIEKYDEEKPQEVIYYYRLKPAKVLINYLEKDGDSDDSNNVILSEQEQIDGHVDDSYNTDTEHRKETITKDGKTYTLVEDSKNTEGAMTVEDINVTYYYLQNTKATVRYVERDPETHEIVKDLEEPYTEEGLVGDEFVTYSKKFDGYKLVESPEQTTINMTKEEQTLIYYYEPVYTGLIENHIDDKTGKILYTETHDISVGESYNIPSKEFAGYDLIEGKLPENSIGIMEEEELVIVNYYYIKKAVLEVNYIDRETGKPLAEQIIDETKHEGDSYTTEEKTFNEYDMVQLEGNKEGTMVVETDEEGNITNNRTVVTYYYAKKSAGVEEHHIDIRTGEELEKPTLHEGHIGDEYNIPSKNFLSYVVATTDKDGNNVLPENAKGKMTEEKQVVNYYYNQPAKVIVHYVEKATGKELEETNPETGELQNSQVVIEGFNQDKYETTAKEFEYYTLIESPEEPNGTMKVEIVKDEEGKDIVNNTIDVYYYYEAKTFNIGVEKEITGIIVNGERRAPTNGKLEKVEIYRKSTESTSVQVEYKIKVSNTGEVSGNATIEENIPEGMSLANNDGTWEEQAGVLRKIIAEINPGETKEYTVVLDWNTAETNMGEKDNIVSIVDTQNIPGFTDNNEKDNTSNANVIISVETGELPIGLIIALIALVGLETVTLRYAVVLTKRQKRKINKDKK